MKNKILGVIVSVLSGVTFMAHGQASLPYSNDFETNSLGSSITNDANWTASSEVVTVITNTTYTNTTYTNTTYLNTVAMNTPYMGSPIDGGAHAQVLSFDTGSSELTNSYSDANTHVVIDTMLQPALSPELIYSDAITQSQFSVSFLTNGVAVWHGMQSGSTYGADYSAWFIMNNSSTPVRNGKWVRLTVNIYYQGLPTDGFGSYNAMFQVLVDGKPLNSPEGHVIADMGSATGGSWMLTARPTTPTQISKLILSGTGMMDDLTLTTNSDPPSSVTENHGIPYNWFTYMGVVTNGSSSNTMATAAIDTSDFDGDGMPNWQEYFAGTEPTNALSKLVIISQSVDATGKATIKWLNAAHPLANYSIAMATNLDYSTTWQAISNNIASEAGGTNSLTA
ncbi:MAG: hypothetical protein WCG36_00715, partial [bacterium]